VNAASILIVTIALAAEGDQLLTKPVSVEIIAVQASRQAPPKPPAISSEKPHEPKKVKQKFDSGLEKIEPVVRDLPFDTFKKLKTAKLSIKPNQEERLAITGRYTVFLTPLAKDKEQRIRIRIRVVEKLKKKITEDGEEKEKVIERQLLATTSAVASKKPLRLGGMKLDKGELVVIVFVHES
jgi:hypothetical protein